MRQLAHSGALLILLLTGVLTPVTAYAEITQLISDTETTDPSTSNGGWSQELGTGLSGSATEFIFPIQWAEANGFSNASGRMGISITACDDPTYSSCSSVSTNSVSFSAPVGYVTLTFRDGLTDAPLNFVFEPTKYYSLRLYRIQDNNLTTRFRVLGSATDTYPFGLTMAGGIADIAFTIQGIDRTGSPPPLAPSVLFLPGIEGSRLYNNSDNKLWEPSFFSDDIQDLYLDQMGVSIGQDVYAKVGDVIESIPLQGGVYGPLEEDFEALKQSGAISDWQAIAYDWRLPIDDLLSTGRLVGDRIYYSGPQGATSTPYIIQELRRLTANGQKVTIVAHSNGGLIAKRLTQTLGDQEAAQRIDKIILVASPQAGTPQAIAAAMHGDDQSLVFGLLLSKKAARTFASTTPMTYNLMPSEHYFTQVDDPVVTFAPELTEWISRYGSILHSKELLDTFLAGSYGRVDALTGDINQPIQLDPGAALINGATQLHSHIDAWTPPNGIQVIQIAGWGVSSTLAGIEYVKKGNGMEPFPIITDDGDGTVPVPSALWTAGSSVSNYWLNLKNFNEENTIQTGLGFASRKHGTLMDIHSVRQLIIDTVTVGAGNSYDYISTARPVSTEPALRYSLRSPLSLDLYDSLGRHTGISTTTGQIEEQIPNTYFLKIGDVKIIATGTDIPVRAYLDGYESGTFTLKVEEVQDDVVIASSTFADIPTTEGTLAYISTEDDIDSLSSLVVDSNGDGVSEHVLAPKLNEVVTLPVSDINPPVTVASTTGTEGVNSWYTSNVSVALTASDAETGVATTTYSLNGGPWSVYTQTLLVTQEGTTTLQYFSTDKAGNTESTNTRVIKIDKVIPEGKIALDPIAKKVVVSRIDYPQGTSSPTTLGAGSASGTVQDGAGNKLVFNFSKNEQKSDRALVTLGTLAYNASSTSPTGVTAKYYWTPAKTGTPALLIAHIKTKDTAVLALYLGTTNKTLIFAGQQSDDSADLATLAATLSLRPRATLKQYSGLVIPFMYTNKGKVNISY